MPPNAPYNVAHYSQLNNVAMECLTLEALPKAFTHLTNEVSEIRQMLLTLSNDKPADTERWMNLDEFCQYHPDKPSKPTVYGWVHNGSIPVHKGGKKLRFLRSEIDGWLLQGRKQTTAEIEAESKAERDTYLLKQKKGKL